MPDVRLTRHTDRTIRHLGEDYRDGEGGRLDGRARHQAHGQDDQAPGERLSGPERLGVLTDVRVTRHTDRTIRHLGEDYRDRNGGGTQFPLS